MADRMQSFAEFWPYYVREHSRPATRWLHFVGTTLALALVVVVIVWQAWWWLLAAPVAGYGLAWIGHFGIEKNRPATFQYPLWSFLGDMKMWVFMLTGRMRGEAARIMAAGHGDGRPRE